MRFRNLLLASGLAAIALASWCASRTTVSPGRTFTPVSSSVGLEATATLEPIRLVGAEGPEIEGGMIADAIEPPLSDVPALATPHIPTQPSPAPAAAVVAAPTEAPPATPARMGYSAADEALPFSVVDMNSEGNDGVVCLPPLPTTTHYRDPGVRRLPPLPDDVPAPPTLESLSTFAPPSVTPSSPRTIPSTGAAVEPTRVDVAQPMKPSAPVVLRNDSSLNTSAQGAAPQNIPSSNEFTPNIPAPKDSALSVPAAPAAPTPAAGATVPPAPVSGDDNPFGALPGADLRPLSELLGKAGATNPSSEGSASLNHPPGGPSLGDRQPSLAELLAQPLPGLDPALPTETPAKNDAGAPPNATTTPPAAKEAEPKETRLPRTNAPTASPSLQAASGNSHPAPPPAPNTTPARPVEAATTSALSTPAARRAMDAVLRKADAHVQRGISLADRRAYYAARTEFLAALRLLAQGLDAQEGGTAHSEALARGVWALEEVNDFIPRGAAMNADLRVERLIAPHRTRVLKSADNSARGVTPLQAVQQYYTYAQEQLAAAVRPTREGSLVLTALGKLYTEMEHEPAPLAADAKTKGLVCQQAALLVDPNNVKAANELGVLLARESRFEEARGWLVHSLTVQPQTEAWHNLAVVHELLGEAKLAQSAKHEGRLLSRKAGLASGGPRTVKVRQVSPAVFAGKSPSGAKPSPAASRTGPAPQTAAKPNGNSTWNWLPWR